MALNSQKSENFYTTSGKDADKISTAELAAVKDLWDKDVASGRNLTTIKGDPHLGPVLYALQQMQNEILELRRYITSNEIATEIDASNLPTSAPKTAGLLWNDRGIVKVS